MLDRSLPVRYARAVYSVSKAERAERTSLEQLRMVCAAIENEKGLRALFDNPAIPGAEKKSLSGELFGGSVSPRVNKLLNLLVDGKRMAYLRAIADELEGMINRAEGRSLVRLVTASTLPDSIVGDARERLAKIIGGTIELTVEVDPSAIGGAKVYTGDSLIDGTLDSALKGLERSIVG